eukprot:TCALIF_10592-PB protein Name:"Protein of unknown function" AED:0.05 eAED:0.05 QI:0/0.94/0.83/1/0.64/0.66/18/4209/251
MYLIFLLLSLASIQASDSEYEELPFPSMEGAGSRVVDMNHQQSSDTTLGENLVNAPREQKPFSSVVYPREHVPFKSHHRRGFIPGVPILLSITKSYSMDPSNGSSGGDTNTFEGFIPLFSFSELVLNFEGKSTKIPIREMNSPKVEKSRWKRLPTKYILCKKRTINQKILRKMGKLENKILGNLQNWRRIPQAKNIKKIPKPIVLGKRPIMMRMKLMNRIRTDIYLGFLSVQTLYLIMMRLNKEGDTFRSI